MKTSDAIQQLIPPVKPLRLADRLRLDSCFSALVQERRILVVHSAHASVLEHHAGLLIERLQAHGLAAIEHFSSVNSDALLSRMNEVLADLSVDQATRPSAPPTLQRVWVVLDAHTLPVNDTQLLIQLLKNFPGAGLSAVLVYQSKNLPQYLVDAQGSRLVSWAIEAEPADLPDAPTANPAQKLAAAGAALGAGVKSASASSATSASSASSAPSAARARSDRSPLPRASRQNRLLGAGLVLTLLLSAGGAAVMQPEASLQLWKQVQDNSRAMADTLAQAARHYLASEASADTRPEAAAAGADAAAAAGAGAQVSAAATAAGTDAGTSTSVGTDAATATGVSSAAGTDAAVAANVSSGTGTGTATGSGSGSGAGAGSGSGAGAGAGAGAVVNASAARDLVATASATAAAAVAPVITPLAAETPPPQIAQRDLQWAQKLPNNYYILTHGVFESFEQAQQNQRSKDYLANARLLPVLVGSTQRHEYLVITGPFKTEERVAANVARLNLAQSTNTLTAADLKKYITLRKAGAASASASRR